MGAAFIVVPITVWLGVKGVVCVVVCCIVVDAAVAGVVVRKFDVNLTVGEEDIDKLPQDEFDEEDDDDAEEAKEADDDKDDGDSDNFVVVICKLSKLKTKSSPAFIWALSIPLSLEKSAQLELADEEFEEAVENDDKELQEDTVTSFVSFEQVSMSFLEISLIDFVSRVSAVSGNSIIFSGAASVSSKFLNAVQLVCLNSSLAKLMPLNKLLLKNIFSCASSSRL